MPLWSVHDPEYVAFRKARQAQSFQLAMLRRKARTIAMAQELCGAPEPVELLDRDADDFLAEKGW